MSKISKALEEVLRKNFEKEQQSGSAEIIIKWLEKKIEGEDNNKIDSLENIIIEMTKDED